MRQIKQSPDRAGSPSSIQLIGHPSLPWIPLRGLLLCVLFNTLVGVIVDYLQPMSRKPRIHQRPLLRPDLAAELQALFMVFANDTRLRLLHALVQKRELCVTDLAKRLGMKPQAVSNQLQRLVDRRILASRRDGLRIYYRIVDPCVPALLDHGVCLVEDTREERR